MDNIIYKDNCYRIINHFYPFDYKEVCFNCSSFEYNNEKRFAFIYIKENKKYISNEAFELINASKELYKYFYSNIDKINTDKFKITLWDSGFWQIRKSLKDAKLASDILKNIKKKREALKKNILKEIDNFIS